MQSCILKRIARVEKTLVTINVKLAKFPSGNLFIVSVKKSFYPETVQFHF